jgi:hypothetical protein
MVSAVNGANVVDDEDWGTSSMWKRLALIALRVAYVGSCLYILFFALSVYAGASDWKTEEGLVFDMGFMAFPSSVVLVAIIALLGAALQIAGTSLPIPSRPELVVEWSLFVAVGYLQWFVLLPRIIQLKKKSRMVAGDDSR